MKPQQPLTVGVILARKGSKGIPNKNLVELYGKPIIQYTIDFAKETQTVDTLDDLAETLSIIINELINSTESFENYPKNLPVGRPNELIPAKHLTVNWGDFELLEITE